MRYRRTQLRGDVIAAERRHHECGENARRDSQEHATAPRRTQRATQYDDRQHGSQGELQPDRLVDQRQDRDDHAIGCAPRQRDRPGACEGQRYCEHRQCGRTEQIRPGGVGRERDSERQQRNQHRNHQPALRPAPTEQHHTHDQGKGAQIGRRRQPAQSERGPEVMSGDKSDQFACETATDEPEGVVDGVIGQPVDVDRHDVDREEQHGRRPHRDRDRDSDVPQRTRGAPLTGFDTQVHHRIGPNGQR